MHIQSDQFISLLAEAAGISEEKVHKQLEELISEISQAVQDGEAYELEDFGIFSQLGERLVFIPSPGLETEINFKYVGMEPIEMDDDQDQEQDSSKKDDPFAGLGLEDDDSTPSKRDPFSGLIEELDEDEIPESIADAADEELPISEEEWDDLPAEDDDPFAGLSDLDDTEESDSGPYAATDDDPDGDDVEEKPGPLQWGISAHTESDDSADRLLSSLMGESRKDDPFSDIDDAFEDPIEDNLDPDDEDDPALEEDLKDVLGEETGADEDEDPFAGLMDEDEKTSDKDEIDEDDVLPVITNISSDLPEAEPKPEKNEKELTKKKSEKAASSDSQKPAPVWLWAVLILVITGGTIAGLGYFNILNIPGISSSVTPSQQVAPQPVNPPAVQEPAVDPAVPVEEPLTESANEVTNEAEVPVAEEPVAATSAMQPVNMPASAPDGQSVYGLRGTASEAGNAGYTIVVYSLSIEESAYREQQRLREQGFRALVTPVPSSQYGTLWRVSIGQFASLRDAAIATDELDESFTQNFFIKKITN